MSPQSSDEQRARWPGWDSEAIEWLESRGYKHTAHWTWIKPPDLSPTEKDIDAVDFLIQEFDWGGFE